MYKMPLHKKFQKKRVSKQSRYRKRQSTRAVAVVRTRGPPNINKNVLDLRKGFPMNLWTSLVYSTFRNFNSVTPNNVYSMNSLYDPDVTGAGSQPRYYDQLLGANNTNAIYRSYRVHAFKVNATIQNTSDIQLWFVWCTSRPLTSGPGTLQEALERRDCRCIPIGTANGGGGVKTLKVFGKIKHYVGHRILQDAENTAASYNSSPPDQVYGTAYVFPADGADTTWSATIRLRITYMAQLYSLNDVPDST